MLGGVSSNVLFRGRGDLNNKRKLINHPQCKMNQYCLTLYWGILAGCSGLGGPYTGYQTENIQFHNKNILSGIFVSYKYLVTASLNIFSEVFYCIFVVRNTEIHCYPQVIWSLYHRYKILIIASALDLRITFLLISEHSMVLHRTWSLLSLNL